MSEQKTCECGTLQYNLAFACSGAADVGAIADQAARQLARDKTAAMCCTAAIAAEVPPMLEKAAHAAHMVVLDGCDQACARKIMEKAGFRDFAYIELGSLGMEKGKTPPARENVMTAVQMAAEALAGKAAR